MEKDVGALGKRLSDSVSMLSSGGRRVDIYASLHTTNATLPQSRRCSPPPYLALAATPRSYPARQSIVLQTFLLS
jgi:hypothetical protein